MSEEPDVQIEDFVDEANEVIPFKYSITSYGADYPVDGLVRRIADGSIDIPSFQRGFVWNIRQASRFIESLLLGLPVPGIFLSREKETQKLLVIDGQQRLRTLQYFYDGIFADRREFALQGVQEEFNHATYKTLKEGDRRRLDDSILHATIVKQDEPSEDDSSIYHIFERLNTGGAPLRPQEIRACIYHGEFNELLKHLNKNKAWRAIFGKIDSRMRDQELLLRFFALYFNVNNYSRPMKGFLNTYMGRNRHLKVQSDETLTCLFTRTIEVIYNCVGKIAFKPERALNSAVFDSVMVAITRRLEKGDILDCDALRLCYEQLLSNIEFVRAFKKATADEASVSRRIALATRAFEDAK